MDGRTSIGGMGSVHDVIHCPQRRHVGAIAASAAGCGDGRCTLCRPTSPALRATLRCSRRAGSRQTRFAQTAPSPCPLDAALLSGASTAGTACTTRRRRSALNEHSTAKPGMRCGVGDPLCAAEERSLMRIRARRCLSAASLPRPRVRRVPQGSPKGRRSGVGHAAPRAGRTSQRARASFSHSHAALEDPREPLSERWSTL